MSSTVSRIISAQRGPELQHLSQSECRVSCGVQRVAGQYRLWHDEGGRVFLLKCGDAFNSVDWSGVVSFGTATCRPYPLREAVPRDASEGAES